MKAVMPWTLVVLVSLLVCVVVTIRGATATPKAFPTGLAMKPMDATISRCVCVGGGGSATDY